MIFFRKLGSAAPKVVGLHLEPFGFQVDGSSKRAQAHREFVVAQNWNLNFYDGLTKAEAAGELAIRRIDLEISSLQFENPTSLALWDNF